MRTLRDLGYGVQVIKNEIGETIVYKHPDPTYPVIRILRNGSYWSFDPISTEIHEAITGTLFKMGVYEMIGKHLRQSN